MFSKILIANRGEIAVRIIRACQELDISTVAVYSELDSQALFVELADEAYGIGGKTAAESYLNSDAILDVIERSGAQAVHPGYGFYSENADFARTVAEAGVTFIGPPPSAIEIMGDKISSRLAAADAQVQGVPGISEFLSDPEQVVQFGTQHGWPVAIKAAFGGGGRGLKVVTNADEVAEGFAAAQREATAYFGRAECYVERYLSQPRHVEVQVLADNFGNVIHLGTRDCSAQRRHQKLIEEAPAPNLNLEMTQAMGDAAIRLAKSCGYTGAGTVEFLVEADQFYFLEMNTRLQVEHCVTEMVSGIDLVAAQILVAAGDPLGFDQTDVHIGGHAIEVRINAEDPSEGKFLPSPGVISKLVTPSGFGVRWDGGYRSGDAISQHYDNLIGKLVCWGPDRSTAIRRTLRALGELKVEGVATTIEADKAILNHHDFQAVKHSTAWVENVLDLSDLKIDSHGLNSTSDDPNPATREPKPLTVEVNGKQFDVKVWLPAPTNSRRPKPRQPSRPGATSGVGSSGEVIVPMQGTVVAVSVAAGDQVAEGDQVVVLEAMKMENSIVAPISGVVMSVNVSVGDTVSGGAAVATIG